jgi:hypothetical protein
MHGGRLFSTYGFLDVQSTFTVLPKSSAALDPNEGWPTAITWDRPGAIVAMIENYRTGLIWKTLSHNLHPARASERIQVAG